MEFKVKETGAIVKVELRTWQSGEGWGIDESQDLMASAVDGLEHDDYEGDYLISEKELDDMLDWWLDECKKTNADPYYGGDGLTGELYGTEPDEEEEEEEEEEEYEPETSWHIFACEIRYDEQGHSERCRYKDYPSFNC